MNSAKQKVKNLIEFFGLGMFFDRMRFYAQLWDKRDTINSFKKEHAAIPLPQPFMIYETFRLDYRRYWESGKEDARWIYDSVREFIHFHGKHVLDWGCGPGRMIRHFPDIEPNASYYGCDYNASYVEWCSHHLKAIDFARNQLLPPLPYAAQSMDLIYAISIFTHLSEESHYLWVNEICRVLKPGGIFFFTAHGDITRKNLLEKEKIQYDNGTVVIRGNVKEGNRMYTAYHPTAFIHKLIEGKFSLLRHKPGIEKVWGLEQDVWIIKKEKGLLP